MKLLRLLNNLLLVYLLYMLCRVVYVMEFWDLYSAGWSQLSLGSLIAGGLRFDTSAIIYTNLLYILLVLIPLPRRWTATKGYQLSLKILFVVVNALMLILNLVDTVYSRYTGRRTTWTFFSEFQNENNLGSIFGIELLNHWYLVLIGIAFILALVYLYRYPRTPGKDYPRYMPVRFILALLCFLGFMPLAVIGMRGGASKAIRPITISNANQYVNQPSEAAIVLNTPFSLIRTMGKTTFTDPEYFDPAQLDALYSPLHNSESACGNDTLTHSHIDTLTHSNIQTSKHSNIQKNIVVLILESFGKEYIGAYNDYPGYTPFLDSIIAHSLTFRYSYANGRKSIDGMPSILSGIPMFVEPFFVTHYSLNNISSIAGELAHDGYTTAFFHGAENGSMGFQAFARTSGFQHYYGRTEYDADSRFGGDADFDGTWAIWDEEFMQYYAAVMEQMPQPFMTALFTASSHHPFAVPERYRQTLHEEGHPLYTCIRYTDQALRHFFATASQMPWYRNTLFVLTADHTNVNYQSTYNSPLGTFSVPIILFDPAGQLPTGISDAVAQQTDIMPTVLGLTGCTRPYIAYGTDLLRTPADQTWAIHYNNGIYQYVQQGRLLLFDGEKATGWYNLITDPLLHDNLIDNLPPADHPLFDTCLLRTKAIIQSYMQRMISNQLTP